MCAIGAPVAISEHSCMSCSGRAKPHRAAWAAGKREQESQTDQEISGFRNVHVYGRVFHPAAPSQRGEGGMEMLASLCCRFVSAAHVPHRAHFSITVFPLWKEHLSFIAACDLHALIAGCFFLSLW